MLLQLLRSFRRQSGQVRAFIINWTIYAIVIIVTTVYVYARLDFVRSGPQKGSEQPANENTSTKD